MQERGIKLFLLCALLLACAAVGFAQDNKGKLNESLALTQQVLELERARKYDEAIPLAEKALKLAEEALGAESPALSPSLNILASVYIYKNDYARAEPLLRRALALDEKQHGADYPNSAYTLARLADISEAKGDYTEAESFYRRALAIRGKSPGKDSADLVEMLDSFAMMYVRKGDAARAKELLQRALAIKEKTANASDAQSALVLNLLGRVAEMQGAYAEAENFYQRALSVAEKISGAESIDAAIALSNLGVVFSRRGDTARAASRLERALAIEEKVLGAEHPTLATTINNLASVYEDAGRYAEAERLYRRALALREKTLGAEHPDVAASLNNLAGLYRTKGDYAEAEKLYRRALAIDEKRFGGAHPSVALVLNNLGALYEDEGDYLRAEPLLARTLEISEKVNGANHPDTAAALNTLGMFYEKKGDYARAEEMFTRALAICEKVFGAEHPRTATTIANLGLLYADKRDYARAEPMLLRALELKEKLFGADHADVAQMQDNLGVFYGERGDYARAETFLKSALATFEKTLGADHAETALALNNLAEIYRGMKDYARAEELLQRALQIYQKSYGEYHPYVGVILHNIATLEYLRGDTARAISYMTRGNAVSEHNLALILTAGSENQKRLYLETLAGEADVSVWLHVRGAPKDVDAARMALTAVLQRKGRALDAMSDEIAALRRRAAPQDRALLERLGDARSELSALQLSEASDAARAARIEELETEIERLEAEISRRSAEFRAQTQPVTLEAVKQAIPDDAALVEIISYRIFNSTARGGERLGAPQYVAYILDRNMNAPQWVELGDAATIDAMIAKLRAALADAGRADVRELARAVDERVMRPVRNLLGARRHIFLSPDGALNLIPFGALVDENGKYLIENYAITYLTSGRDLLRLQIHGASPQAPVIVANPKFDLSGAGKQTQTNSEANLATANRRSSDFVVTQYPTLPGTEIEAKSLARLMPDSQMLVDSQATEAALKSVHHPRILHIATHGFFLDDQKTKNDQTATRGLALGLDPKRIAAQARGENPLLRSGLILAGVNQQQSGAGEDGILTALEAANLDLWGTKLVVLSACETGLGEVKNGDGVYGLRRALVLAGSESQVMSLWKVADAATRDLMIDFYKRLEAGEGRTEALRQAQLSMLRDAKRAHPFYWAAFIQSGDWRSMNER